MGVYVVGYIFLIVFGLALIMVGATRQMLEFCLFGFLSILAAFAVLIIGNHADKTNGHNKVLADLQSEGWNVGTHDVHWMSDRVDLKCVSFKTHELNGKWQVVVKRSDSQGGGFNIVSSSKQKGIEAVC